MFGPRFRRYAPPCGVALAAFVAYLPSLGYPLVWDDLLLRRLLEERFRAGGLGALLTSEFLLGPHPTGYYRPLVLLSLWLDGRLEAHLPGAYHLTNLLLHAANSLLVFRLIGVVAASATAAWWGGLLFALHPVHVESVVFVSGRTDLWAALLVLAAALLWARPPGVARTASLLRLAGSGAALAAAALAKETAFMLPAVLLCWDALGPRDPGGAGPCPSRWSRTRPWLLTWGLSLGAALVLRLGVAGVGFGGAQRAGGVFDLLLLPRVAAMDFRLLLAPWPQNAFYSPAELVWSLGTIVALFAVVGLCLLAGTRAGDRLGLRALIWIAGFLLPTWAVVGYSRAPVAERFLYLPSIGICLVAGSLLERLGRHPARRWLPALVGGGAAILGAVAIAVRTPAWKDEISLFSGLVSATPGHSLPHYNLGNAYREAGRPAEAVAEYREAARLNPQDAEIANNLGSTLESLGREEDAREAYEAAVRVNPGMTAARFNLGIAYQKQGRLEEARQAFAALVRIAPGDAEAWLNLGTLSYRLRRHADAAAALGNAVRLEPRQAAGRYYLGLALLALGDRPGATAQARALWEIDPAWAGQLARALEQPPAAAGR